jgi:hypothetical protein
MNVKKMRRPTPPSPKAEPVRETEFAGVPADPTPGGWHRLPGGQWAIHLGILDESALRRPR